MNITTVTMYQVGNAAYPTLQKAEDSILERIDKLVSSVASEKKLDFKRAQIVAMVEHLLRNRRELADLLGYEFEQDDGEMQSDGGYADRQLQYPFNPANSKPAKKKPWEK